MVLPLVPAGAPESANSLGAPLDGRLAKLERHIAREYHLRDALAMHDASRDRGVVAHDDHPLLRVIGVDGAGSVRNGQRMLERLAAARPDLRLDVVRQPRSKAERDEGHLPRREIDSPTAVSLVGLALHLR